MLAQTIITLSVALNVLPLPSTWQLQDPADKAREEVCQRVACRPPTTVRLRLNDKEYSEMEFPRTPYVADGFINVLVGEELNVEFDESEGRLTNATYSKTLSKPERTVTLSLQQTEKGTVLKVKNLFGKAIVYDCMIQHYNEQRLQKTSIIPVRGGLVNYEIWPYPVAQVLISNVRYSKE